MICFIVATVWIAAWERSVTSAADQGLFRLEPKQSTVKLRTELEALGMVDGELND
jgi:hypothetical protein